MRAGAYFLSRRRTFFREVRYNRALNRSVLSALQISMRNPMRRPAAPSQPGPRRRAGIQCRNKGTAGRDSISIVGRFHPALKESAESRPATAGRHAISIMGRIHPAMNGPAEPSRPATAGRDCGPAHTFYRDDVPSSCSTSKLAKNSHTKY